MKITALARGQACTVRGPTCNGNPETTVATHFRSQRLGAGMGIKPPDLFIAFACSDCHDVIDGRRHVQGFDKAACHHMHMLGVLETQHWLLTNGHIRIGAK